MWNTSRLTKKMTDRAKNNSRASKFDQDLYGDTAEYGQNIGETDEREADIAAKLEASKRKNA